MWILVLLLTAFAGITAGQVVESPPAKPLMEYAGTPLRIEYRCTAEDMDEAGLACSHEEPCPIFLELSALEPVGNRIFLLGNIHSADNTLYSVLIASKDGGKTWAEPFERLRGGGLDSIQFIDFDYGWISGQFLHPLPKDPFLLMSSDGGRTWRRQDLFGETRAGSILQFAFTSRTSGRLVLDRGQGAEGGRYELYESSNGGATWLLRETANKPYRLKSLPEPNPDWRLHADRASRAFLIEHRQAGRWSTLAAFSVALPPCSSE